VQQYRMYIANVTRCRPNKT